MKIEEAVNAWYQARVARMPRGRSKPSAGPVREHAPLPHTAIAYREGVEKLLEMLVESGITGAEDLSRLTVEEFIRFPAWLSAYVSPKTEERIALTTAKLYMVGVMNFYTWLKIYNLIEPAPNAEERFNLARRDAFSQRSKRERRLVEVEDVEQLLALIDHPDRVPEQDSPLRERNAAIITLMARSGLRVSEVCRLKVGDIDLDRLQGRTIGKGDKQAVFRFNGESARKIRAYLEARAWPPRTADPLFAAHDKSIGKDNPLHRHLTRGAVSQMLDAYGKAAGVKVWAHALRHYFIKTTYEATHDITLAQSLARHDRLETTGGYIDMSQAEIERKYREIYDRALRPAAEDHGTELSGKSGEVNDQAKEQQP